MNVLFIIRQSLSNLSGGDKIQILGTKQALEKLGVRISVSSEPQPDLNNIDIVHAFNPSQLSTAPLKAARAKKIPVVVSTIHWDMREYYRAMFAVNKDYLTLKPSRFLQHYLSNQFRTLLYNFAWNPYINRKLQSIFQLADMLLPNSNAEARLIERQFSIPLSRCSVIVNGFDTSLADHATPGRFAQQHRLKDFILCVGRIEYRKNQLALIQALMDFQAQLVFIGKEFNLGYAALCKKLGKRRGNTVFIDHINQQELFNAYADAKVHALVSWYETPGLASLEAGAVGTPLVVSRRGSTEEYFGELAEYCEPDNPASIRTAIERAWNKPKGDALQRRIRERCTWDEAARQTLSAYRRLKSA
jgi:glycosyltransferase involved in cell wall biosynthesis